MAYQPIIIIGSVRSGTNMLRDILVKIPNYGTWDCDEINAIWRHGNINHPHDEFTSDMATPSIIKFIRNEFKKLSISLNVSNVVEKTTHNSLRVAYVHKIFPEAKYIFIYRDGRDVAASAIKRWKAPFEFSYTLKKFRYVPLVDKPYFAWYYAANRLKKVLSKEEKLSTWGPRYNGIDEDVKKHSLIEVCGLQWKHYIESTAEQIKLVKPTNLFQVRYEDLVQNPDVELGKLCQFLNLDTSIVQTHNLSKGISAKSIGNWKKLPQEEQELLSKQINQTLTNFGYLKSEKII